ncbi:unnamed protein product [Miscanthus lutarioriparius]|uniref:Brf1 TBP-binding domain-containing protein n=1 Tax=Miscanthus lutarioriparius TaxID=422564 RepID=A0A811RVW5_9POAL|nr:unnamed protein product [Miscanthus lutarioriparius]
MTLPPKDPEEGGENCEGNADPESLSDIDDVEVDWYLHNEEETQYKKIIWEEMNKEYLEEQAAKEALAAELAARGTVVEEGNKKKRRRNEDTKSSTPAETPAEATYNMLKRKGLGSKINEGAVGELYKRTRDEVGSASKEEEMDFDALLGRTMLMVKQLMMVTTMGAITTMAQKPTMALTMILISRL